MAAGIEQLMNSSMGLNLAAFVARAAPPRLGYAVAASAAWWVSSRGNGASVKAVRANQRMVTGSNTSSGYLDQAVRAVFRSSARSIYELYHYIQQPTLVERLYGFDHSFQPYMDRPEFDRRGLVIAGIHMAGFDLGLRWLCKYRFKPLVLTLASPEAGRQQEFEARRKMNMNLLPTSVSSLRHAVRHLQNGGMVLTGLDQPVPDCEIRPRFFGRASALPVDHVYMALKARVPIAVVASRLEHDGTYCIHASPPIEMEPHPGRTEELQINAEKVLTVAESFIKTAPQQWLIFRPVWPEPMNGTPE